MLGCVVNARKPSPKDGGNALLTSQLLVTLACDCFLFYPQKSLYFQCEKDGLRVDDDAITMCPHFGIVAFQIFEMYPEMKTAPEFEILYKLLRDDLYHLIIRDMNELKCWLEDQVEFMRAKAAGSKFKCAATVPYRIKPIFRAYRGVHGLTLLARERELWGAFYKTVKAPVDSRVQAMRNLLEATKKTMSIARAFKKSDESQKVNDDVWAETVVEDLKRIKRYYRQMLQIWHAEKDRLGPVLWAAEHADAEGLDQSSTYPAGMTKREMNALKLSFLSKEEMCLADVNWPDILKGILQDEDDMLKRYCSRDELNDYEIKTKNALATLETSQGAGGKLCRYRLIRRR